MRRLPGTLVHAGSGILFALAFPRVSLWPLALVALVPLLIALDRREAPTPALAGIAWGAGFFGVLLSWLYGFFRHYGRLSPPLSLLVLAILVGYLALYPGLFAHFGSLLLQRHGMGGWLLLPALWVALEWIRGHALTGFPWGLAGYALTPCLPLIQIASLTGVYGVSFLVLLANALGASWIRRGPGKGRWLVYLGIPAGLAGGAALAFGCSELMLERVPRGTGIEVGIVQASIPQDRKWSPDAARAILEKHERFSAEAAERGARLILWPESSSPFPLTYPATAGPGAELRPNREYRDRMQSLASRLGSSILFGSVDYRPTSSGIRPVNAAALVRPDGTWGEVYAKIHLVPFGEYVPVARILSFVNRVAQGAIGDFLPGGKPVVATAGDLEVGTAICYEMIFPELIRRFPMRGARVLANLTNDAWFGDSAGPDQHFQMTVVRAVENGRYLIRAANTGISAIVDPRGRVTARTRIGESRVLTGTVRPGAELTFYTRFGNVFAIGCAILAAAALAAGFAAKGLSGTGDSGGDE